jgi:hypothetical protein
VNLPNFESSNARLEIGPGVAFAAHVCTKFFFDFDGSQFSRDDDCLSSDHVKSAPDATVAVTHVVRVARVRLGSN